MLRLLMFFMVFTVCHSIPFKETTNEPPRRGHEERRFLKSHQTIITTTQVSIRFGSLAEREGRVPTKDFFKHDNKSIASRTDLAAQLRRRISAVGSSAFSVF
jgi:hypothetical protein